MSTTMEEKEKPSNELKQVLDKRFTNKKFFNRDFSNMDLTNADFRSCILVECNFKGSDLSMAAFKDANCYGSDFTDTILHRTSFENANMAKTKFYPKKMWGMTITLTCDTFAKMEISRTALLYWLFIPTMMTAPDEESTNRIIAAIGQENYAALAKVFREQIIT